MFVPVFTYSQSKETNSVASASETRVGQTPDNQPPSLGAFEYVFPAIRGRQAGKAFFASMCPLRLIPKVFLFDEDELVPELRAQRVLNKGRLPELARYIVDNPSDYVFSALTASIDGEVTFEASTLPAHGQSIGLLRIPMTARFVINDGQHRRAAIELALKERPELADESIAVVFFMDAGLERSQQMFADLNRHAVKPSPSIGVLYDHREDLSRVVRQVVLSSRFFRDLVETERTTLAVRSRKLFTLSALYTGTRALLRDRDDSFDESAEIAHSFWHACGDVFADWHAVHQRRLSAGDVRRDYLHSHGIVLQALGCTGNVLLSEAVTSSDFVARLQPLAQIDWSRQNAALWEGRALTGGRVTKGSQNVVLTTNVLLHQLGLPLPDENQQAEHAFSRRSA
jgi:DNA sulfur modification protein DndB